jgi:hypothetical protein
MSDERESLRSIMQRGGSPLEGLDDAELDLLATVAIELEPPPNRDNGVVELLEATGDDRTVRHIGWLTEIASCGDIRKWIVSLLPPYLVACHELIADFARRPYALEAERGTFSCAACGDIAVDRHIRIVDRAGLDLDTDVLTFCVSCVSGAIASP